MSLDNSNRLTMSFHATTDRTTVVNMCNHCYWNLQGPSASSTILNHTLQLNADRYTAVDEKLIPTGELASVAGTPLDFRTTRLLGEGVQGLVNDVSTNGGIDHNFVINRQSFNDSSLIVAGILTDPVSGRIMTISTTAPGIQW